MADEDEDEAYAPIDFWTYSSDECLAWLVENRYGGTPVVTEVGEVHWTLVRLCRRLQREEREARARG